jgi:hypothetical protein
MTGRATTLFARGRRRRGEAMEVAITDPEQIAGDALFASLRDAQAREEQERATRRVAEEDARQWRSVANLLALELAAYPLIARDVATRFRAIACEASDATVGRWVVAGHLVEARLLDREATIWSAEQVLAATYRPEVKP